MKLVKYDTNWADEFDVIGFAVMNQEQYNEWQAVVYGYFETCDKTHDFVELGFGTNESMEYANAEQFFYDHKVIDITSEEVVAYQHLIGNNSRNTYGIFFDTEHWKNEIYYED